MFHNISSKKPVLTATLSAIVLVTCTQQALTDSDKDGVRRGPRKGPDAEKVFEHLDEDGDGVLNQEEFSKAFERRMQRVREMIKGHVKNQSRRNGGDAETRRPGPPHAGARVIHIHHHYYNGGGPRGLHNGPPHHVGDHFGHPKPPHHRHMHGDHGHRHDLRHDQGNRCARPQGCDGEREDDSSGDSDGNNLQSQASANEPLEMAAELDDIAFDLDVLSEIASEATTDKSESAAEISIEKSDAT